MTGVHAHHQHVQRLRHGLRPLVRHRVHQPHQPVAQWLVQIRTEVHQRMRGVKALQPHHYLGGAAALRGCRVGGQAEEAGCGCVEVALRAGLAAGMQLGRAKPQRLRRVHLPRQRKAPVLQLQEKAASRMIGDDEIARLGVSVRHAQVLAHHQRMHQLHRQRTHIRRCRLALGRKAPRIHPLHVFRHDPEDSLRRRHHRQQPRDLLVPHLHQRRRQRLQPATVQRTRALMILQQGLDQHLAACRCLHSSVNRGRGSCGNHLFRLEMVCVHFFSDDLHQHGKNSSGKAREDCHTLAGCRIRSTIAV